MATLTLDTEQRSLPEVEEGSPRAERSHTAARARGDAPPRPLATRDAPPAGRTLDDLIAGTWSALLVSRAAACLVCGGDVTPRYGSGPHPVGGTCRSCGTEIA